MTPGRPSSLKNNQKTHKHAKTLERSRPENPKEWLPQPEDRAPWIMVYKFSLLPQQEVAKLLAKVGREKKHNVGMIFETLFSN